MKLATTTKYGDHDEKEEEEEGKSILKRFGWILKFYYNSMRL